MELKRGWLSGTSAKDAFVELTVIKDLFGMRFHLIQSIHHRYMTNVRLSMVQNMGISFVEMNIALFMALIGPSRCEETHRRG